MQIKRVFNNNVAMAVTEDGAEIIVIGRGLCFGRHAGDNLDASLVEKTYDLRRPDQDEAAFARMEKLIQSIPTIYLVIAEEIAWMLRESFDPDIDDGIVMALADHISLSLEREKNGVVCENPLLPEIRNFYRKEYALAGNAARIIETYTGICISPQEQGFITLHIVNSTMRQRADRLIVSVELVRDVLSIVSTYYGVALDETSLAYERFLRHLQFFAQRALDPSAGQVTADALFSLAAQDYPRAFGCATQISDHLKNSFSVYMTDAEKSYLAYHIVNLLGEPGPQA